jgi:glutathione S-transferase
MSPSTRPTITAFERSPDGGRGLARDMRVRWALEEVGQPCDVRPVSFTAMKEAAHRRLHPFGRIPTYEDGEVTLFESGAIVLRGAAGLPPRLRGTARLLRGRARGIEVRAGEGAVRMIEKPPRPCLQ